MDCATSRDLHRVRQSPQQALADLPGTPVRLLALGCHDCRFNLLGQLVGVPEWPASPIAEPFQTTLFIPLEDLVTSFPRNVELAAQRSHTLPVLESNHKSHSF